MSLSMSIPTVDCEIGCPRIHHTLLPNSLDISIAHEPVLMIKLVTMST